MYYPISTYKPFLAIECSYDSEGRNFKILNDDIEGISAKSDQVKPKQGLDYWHDRYARFETEAETLRKQMREVRD